MRKNVAAIFGLVLALWAPCRVAAADFPRFDGKVEADLMSGDFARLEALADTYRAPQSVLDDNIRYIHYFYSDLSNIKHAECACEGKSGLYTFDEKRDAIAKWQKALPESKTATIAMAALYEADAWVERSGGAASEVSDEQWRLYFERLHAASEIIAPLDAKFDPYIYELQYGIAESHRGARPELDAIYQQEVRDFPNYIDYYTTHARMLEPYWFGRPGELAAYLKSLRGRPGGETGAMLTIYLAASAVWMSPDHRYVSDETGLTYHDLLQAYDAWNKPDASNNYGQNLLMIYALTGGDRDEAAELAKKIDGKWNRGVFRTKVDFDNAAAWASAPWWMRFFQAG